MALWNAGEWDYGCRRLAYADDGKRVWSYVKTGKVLPNGKPEYKFVQGLANRRDAEYKLCLTGETS
jgi:GH24 family phage-related lysozyme (muramidase)